MVALTVRHFTHDRARESVILEGGVCAGVHRSPCSLRLLPITVTFIDLLIAKCNENSYWRENQCNPRVIKVIIV